MPTLSPVIIQLMSTFACAFTQPTYTKMLLLVSGAILAPRQRTIAAILRVMGLGQEVHYSSYHQVFNRAVWSPWVLSRLLLALLVQTLLQADDPLILLIDETIERRKGEKIGYKSWFRDPVRSSGRHLSAVMGIRWVCLALLVPLPWSPRAWALPFAVVPALSQDAAQRMGKRQRTVVAWAMLLVSKVRRWQPTRKLILVGDGSYAAIDLIATCQQLSPPVTFVSRLRLDAKLHDFPQRTSRFGPVPKKGERLASPLHYLNDPQTAWQPLQLTWYQGLSKQLLCYTAHQLWAKRGAVPVAIRWLCVQAPDDEHFKPEAFFCSDPEVPPAIVLSWVIARWNLEVTFAELRAHLGLETQRHWALRAVERTTPALFALFSLVVLCAHTLHPASLPMRSSAWYAKQQPTFSDALAAVRAHLWRYHFCDHQPLVASSSDHDPSLLFQPDHLPFWEILCYSS